MAAQPHPARPTTLLRRLGRWTTVGLVVGCIPAHVLLQRLGLPALGSAGLVLLTMALTCLALEWWIPRGGLGERPPGTVSLDIFYNALSGGLNVLVPALVLIPLGHAVAPRFDGAPLWPQDLPFWLDVVLCTLLADFVSYWWHRLEHSPRFPDLWRIHAVHHTPRYYDFFMGGHVHPLDVIIFACITAGLAALLGVPEATIDATMLFAAVVGGMHHLDAETDLGVLNRLIPFADHHTVHHSRATDENGNFGNITTLFDQLFGTWLPPRPFADQPTGAWSITADYPHDSLWFQLMTPFGRTWRKAKGELPMDAD